MKDRKLFNRVSGQVTIMMVALLVAAFAVGSANAQHLISTKAGFINRADGKVMIQRVDNNADNPAGRASLGTQMRDGDLLFTEADARAEVLLNPGSYLRLNEKTQIRAIATSFSATRFELQKGSVIVEIGQIDKKLPIELVTPNGIVTLNKIGLLRVDVKTGATWVAVRQGEALLGTRELALDGKGEKIKRGKLARLTTTPKPELAKVETDTIDEFDAWSFGRAQTLVAANLASLRQNSVLAGGWFYNSFYGCYTFIPGRGYLVSPYGFGFFRNYADCMWYNPFGYGYGYYGYPGYGVGGTTGTTSNMPTRVIAGIDRDPIRREIPAERGVVSDGRGYNSDNMGGFRSVDRGVSTSSSTMSAPSSVTTISAPAPTRSDSGGGDAGRSLPSRGN